MSDKEQYLDRGGVSHFYLIIKSKLTKYFDSLFVKIRPGYDLSQNDFTNELKEKLVNLSSGNGDVIVEDDVIFANANIDNDTNSIIIDDTNKQIISDYINSNNEKYLILKLDNVNAYLYYTSGQFSCLIGGTTIEVFVTTNDHSDIFTKDNIVFEVSFSSYITDNDIKGAQESYQDHDILNYGGISEYINKKIDDLGVYEEVVEGYFNDEDGKFYTDSNLETVITGETSKLYIDLDSNRTFRFGGTTYVKLESSSGLSALSNDEIDEIIRLAEESVE